MKNEYDVTHIRGSISAYQSFIKSHIWHDMKTELDVWAKLAAQEYDVATDFSQVAKAQGRREAIEYLMTLPDLFLEALMIERDKETENE